MHGLARADVYYFADAPLLGRLQDIPQPLEVDEEGLVVVGIADEVNRGVNDAIHAADGSLHRVVISYIAVDHFAAVPIAVYIPIRLPSLGAVVKGADIVFASQVLQDGAPQPTGGTEDHCFHGKFLPSFPQKRESKGWGQ